VSDLSTLPALTAPHALPPDVAETFRAHGHVRLRGVASPGEVAGYREAIRAATFRLNQETRDLAERDTFGKAFLQVMNLWRQDEAARAFTLAPRFAGVAAELLGAERVRIYHDQALFKEAGGGPTPWHQDATYWPFEAQRSVTMWMPLVDVAEDMGGMSFATGSHRDGALGDQVISDASESYFDEMIAAGRFPVEGPVRMAAGDATFHAGWTLHRAHPNTSSTVREVMTVIYVADGVRVTEPHSAEQRHDLATWLPGLQPGDPVASELNPLVPGPEAPVTD
jgi:ectoine hydroxylase-related dioxygenase (phytanoyl-CoA dioxygenase family)